MKIRRVVMVISGLVSMGLLASHVEAATAVGAGSGHPWVSNGSIPWSVTNAGNANLFDNYVCYQVGGTGGQNPQSWVIPLSVPTSTATRTLAVTQTRSPVSTSIARSQVFTFNPNGSVFAGFNEVSPTFIANINVPPGGTAFTKHFLSFDVDGGLGCIYTVTFN
jgi:hypothetical protein